MKMDDKHEHDDSHVHDQQQHHGHGDHNHDHAVHDHDHDHSHSSNPVIAWLQHLFTPHNHGHHQAALDPNLATDRGMWALKISLVGLLVTAVFQVFVVAISGSVALLADTIHNFSDALTAIPLGLAFWLSRRARNKRYTYGYGRAEDIAGVIIVLMIAFSAGEAIYQSILRIINPEPISNLGWVAAAAVIGFLGNELVAVFRIRVGKEIGSAALVADGYHARTDGLTSLAVLAGAIGVWFGFPLADPIVGLIVTLMITKIAWDSARSVFTRILDGVEPNVQEDIRNISIKIPGVKAVNEVRVRWLGHEKIGELNLSVAPDISVEQGHEIAKNVRKRLLHALPQLTTVTVHIDPAGAPSDDFHAVTAHHYAKD